MFQVEKHILELSAVKVQANPDIKKGVVYKRVPHVTLKSIANNPGIKAGMTREAIDAAILRHADTEFSRASSCCQSRWASSSSAAPALIGPSAAAVGV